MMTGVGKSGISRAGPHSRVEGWHLKEGFYAAVWAQNLLWGTPVFALRTTNNWMMSTHIDKVIYFTQSLLM